MPIAVGLNGFGRIARIVLRTCFMRSNIEIIAINDPVIDIEYICYLIKFDSTHGKFNSEISFSVDEIINNGKKIKVFHEKYPSSIPWHTLGVEYVVEASGMFSNMDKASGHLNGVKCVLVTTPSVDIPMLILGVNEDLIEKDERVISCASSTLYCLAPIAKVIEDNFGVCEGFVTSIHAMTPSLKPLDGLCLKGRHWRDHRGIHQNIIPAATGACKALGKIIPSLNDKFCGLTFRVPTVNVSVLDITVKLNKSTNIQEIAVLIEKEGNDKMKNIISTSYDEAVSSDFINDEHSCILDVNSSLELTPKSFKLICWYENEYSYACRVIDTIFFLQQRFETENPTKLSVRLQSESACDVFKNYGNENHTFRNKINTIAVGTDLEDNWNKNIPNVPLTKPLDKQSGQDTEENVDEEKIVKNIVYDDDFDEKSGQDVGQNVGKEMIIKNIVYYDQGNINISHVDEQSNKIIENRERLESAKKELAKIASKTEDLLKETGYEKVKETSTVLEPSRSAKAPSNPNDKNTDSIAIVKNVDSLVNILCGIKTQNTKETTREETDATYESIIEDLIVEENIMDVEPKNQTITTHNIEASIIISDKSGKEHTIVSIKPNKTTQSINRNINRTSRSHEHFNCDKISGRNSSEQNDIAYPLEFRNKRHISRNIKINKIENGVENKKSNIILESSISLDSKKLLKLDKNYSDDEKPQISEHRESNKNEMIKKKILSSVLETSNGDVLPAFDYFKLINKRECITNDNLLDKLASETDSDFSFRTDETKSQIIDITDFSSSSDDLARIDKICKIIEISDELSDELFSALTVDSKSGRKKWSFKELCEKIKLDEFCEKIFGHSVNQN
ncbi:uncharacterized protein LOC121735174 [Aricia agestis]|uniref:uncharacterized protein LOC121735174 n=1 Tax=Aricia agestis TaxID=91739 RepID=UPI001C20C1A8|nr:uncharacterized protein LOC121735174 [Aricia agestis]